MEIAILLVQIAVSIVWIQQGFARYGFWEDKTPAGGFVPIIFALLVLGVSLAILFRRLMGKENQEGDGAGKVFDLANFIPATAAIVGALMIQLVGIAPAVFFKNDSGSIVVLALGIAGITYGALLGAFALGRAVRGTSESP